jgi:hypothetical protein
MSDGLKEVLKKAKAAGASTEQLLRIAKTYKKKDSTESQSTGQEETTSTASTQEETGKNNQTAPQLPPQLSVDMAAAAKLERVKQGELDAAPRTEYERYKAPEAPKKIENEKGEMVDPRYVEVQRKKAQQRKEQEARDLGYFDGVDKDIDPSAPVNEQNAKVRQDILENIDRAKRGYDSLQDTKLGEQLGIDTDAPTKLEDYNAKLRKAQQIITQLDDMVENGVNLSGQYHAYAKNEELTSEQVEKFTQQAINDVSEILGVEPSGLDLNTLRDHVNRNKNFTEGVLFEQTIDRAAYKEATESSIDTKYFKNLKSKDFTFTRTATLDAVLNLGNQVAVAAYDMAGNSVEAERMQQRIAERSVRASLELGHDIYDSKGATEHFEEGNWGVGLEKLTMMTAQSYLPMAVAMINPAAGVAYGGVSSGFGTYEAYRDRGDLTESEKFLLSTTSASVEAAITAIGMGNIRRARAAAGVVDVAGEMSTAARRKAYKKALDFLEPSMTRVSNALKNPAVRGATTFGKDVLEEQAEELSIAALQQGLAYAIANDKFDKYEFADTFLSTIAMSSPTSGMTAVRNYKNYSLINAMPSVDNMNAFEALQSQYIELKETLSDETLSPEHKAIIKNEMRNVKKEIYNMKIASMDMFDSMSEEDQNKLIAVNSQIRKLSKLAKETENETALKSVRNELKKALDFKRELEGGKRQEPSMEGTTTEAPQATPETGVTLDEAVQQTEQNKAVAEEKRASAEERMKPKDTPREMVNRRVRYTNPVNGEVVEGVLAKDGQRLVVETDKGQIFDVGNFDELADQNVNEVKSVENNQERTRLENQLDAKEQRKQQLPAKIKELRDRVKNTNSKAGKDKLRTQIQELKAEQGTIDQDIENLKSDIDAISQEPATEQKVLPIELAETTTVSVNEDGTFKYNSTKGAAPKGTDMKPVNGLKSIRRDKNGNITRVVMTSLDGANTYNLKGQDAQDMAYQLYMQEMSTPEGQAKVDAEFEADAEAMAILEQEESKVENKEVNEKAEETESVPETPEATEGSPAQGTQQTVQQTDRIRTEGDVNLTNDSVRSINRVLSALGVVVPDINIVLHSSRDSYNNTHKNANKDVGHYNPNTNTMHMLVDGNNPLNLEGWLLLKHEAIHPVLDAILANDPQFANLVESRVKSIMNRYAKGTPQQQRVLDHYGRYAGRSDQSLELLTEFINVFSEPDGLRMISKDRTALQKVADLFQSIIDRILGGKNKAVPASKKEIIDLVKNINEAFTSGRQIDVVKTKAEVREGQIRQSLRRDNDLNNAISPNKGQDAESVLNEWKKSNSNFIVAKDFDHSIELRRMGFVESYQRPDGKIVMSVPVKYESYDASTNVAKIKKDSFIKESDITEQPKKKVHNVLKSLGKLAEYNIEFVDRPDLKFSSTLVIPDADNGLNEMTVVANLAYANERTGAGGFSFAVLETLRKKNPEALNKLYSDLKKNKKATDLFETFNRYVNVYKPLLPSDKMSNEDLEFAALAKVLQESIDKVITESMSVDEVEFLSDAQKVFSDIITEQTEQNGDLIITEIPFGENFIPALNSLFVKKEGIKLSEDIEVEEKKIIDRLVDILEGKISDDVNDFKSSLDEILKYFNSENRYTMIDGIKMLEFTSDISTKDFDAVLKHILNASKLPSFTSNDNAVMEMTKDYISLFKIMNTSGIDSEAFSNIEFEFFNPNSTELTPNQRNVVSMLRKIADSYPQSMLTPYFDFQLKNFKKQNYGTSFNSLISKIISFDKIEDLVEAYSPEERSNVILGFGLIDQMYEFDKISNPSLTKDEFALKAFDAVEDLADSSSEIFENYKEKISKTKVSDEQIELVKNSKSLVEAMKHADSNVNYDDFSGLFTVKLKFDDFKHRLPKKISNPVETKDSKGNKFYVEKGAEVLLNKDAVLEISIGADFNISYQFKDKKYGGYYDYPSNWKIGDLTMPLVFEHVNKIGSLMNAKSIKFSAVEAAMHPEISEKQYNPAQIERFKNPSPVSRRMLNNAAAIRNGNMVNATINRSLAFTLPNNPNKLYTTNDRTAAEFISTLSIKKENPYAEIGKELKDKGFIDKIKYKEFEISENSSLEEEAFKINSTSVALSDNGEVILNNAPMRSAYENSEKYISPAGIRQMLTPEDAATGRKAAAAVDQMEQNASDRAIKQGKGRRLAKIKDWTSRESLIDRAAKLKKAMEEGLADWIKAQFTNLNGSRANADRQFHKIEKKIFGGLNTTEEVLLDKIIYLRRVIQIDTNWDNRYNENQIKLADAKSNVESLRQVVQDSKTKEDKAKAKKRLSEAVKTVKYFESQVDKYSVRPMHPTDGTIPINLENAVLALRHYEQQLGAEKMSMLNERVKMYFDSYKEILQETYEAGIIDKETRDRFINDEYSPRVFLQKMFEDSEVNTFEAMNLSEDQIKGIKDGSETEIFTDARFLLNMSLRTLRDKQARNKIYRDIDEQAAKQGYNTKSGFIKEANYKRSKINDEIREDGFGNRVVEPADKGFKNVFYRVDGKLRAFQILEEYHGELTGTDKRSLMSPDAKRRARRYSGVNPLKMFATGIKPVFAIVSALRGFQEVTRGRGVYDQYKFLPAMQFMAMVDFFKGVQNAVLDTDLVNDYFAHGGGMTFMTTEGRPDKIFKRKNSVSRKLLGKLNPVKGTVQVLAYAGEKSELGLRLAIYQRALSTIKEQRPDLTIEQQKALAVEEARLLADFSQGGYRGKDIDSFKPYLNAAIQGTRGTVEYARKNPKMFIAKQVQSAVINAGLTMLAKMMMGDEEWDKTAYYIKNRYNLIPTFLTDENGKAIMLRVPKAHQFMFFDKIASIAGEGMLATLQGKEFDFNMYKKNEISGLSLDEDGLALVDAFLSSMPVGDLIPAEVFTPAKLTMEDFTWQVLSNIPTFGFVDAYTNNIDRYRESMISYDFERVHPHMESHKDGRTRDIYKFLTGIYNNSVAPANTASAARLQAATEKLVTNESNSVISFLYSITDAMIKTSDEKEGVQFKDKDKKTFDYTLGLKRSFIYTAPDKKYNINEKKLMEDIDKHERGDMKKVKKDIINIFKNNEYKFGDKLPKAASDYLKSLPLERKRFGKAYIENMAKGFEVDPVFIEIKYSASPIAAAAKLKLSYGFDSWNDLEDDVKKDIANGLSRAGYNPNKEFMYHLKQN